MKRDIGGNLVLGIIKAVKDLFMLRNFSNFNSHMHYRGNCENEGKTRVCFMEMYRTYGKVFSVMDSCPSCGAPVEYLKGF